MSKLGNKEECSLELWEKEEKRLIEHKDAIFECINQAIDEYLNKIKDDDFSVNLISNFRKWNAQFIEEEYDECVHEYAYGKYMLGHMDEMFEELTKRNGDSKFDASVLFSYNG